MYMQKWIMLIFVNGLAEWYNKVTYLLLAILHYCTFAVYEYIVLTKAYSLNYYYLHCRYAST